VALHGAASGVGRVVPDRYDEDFKSAFRVFQCERPHTILFFSPDWTMSSTFLRSYAKNVMMIPIFVADVSQDVDIFASKLESFLDETTVGATCPKRLVVLDVRNGFDSRVKDLLEPGLDDSYSYLRIRDREYNLQSSIVVIVREFDRQTFDPQSWRANLVDEWTGRFVQRLRYVVGLEQ